MRRTKPPTSVRHCWGENLTCYEVTGGNGSVDHMHALINVLDGFDAIRSFYTYVDTDTDEIISLVSVAR